MFNTISDPLAEAAARLFGLAYLFPYQRLVITGLLEAARAAGIPVNLPRETNDTDDNEDEPFVQNSSGRQIVVLPTGSGKSLCFQLPALLMEGVTLVIYPLLSLMADQQRRLGEQGFTAALLRGGQSIQERDALWEKLKPGGSRFIIANPEVLLTASVKERLKSLNIVHIVIDEAHCVSEWGEQFRPSYLQISSIIAAVRPPLVTAFTATAGSAVLEKIDTHIFSGAHAHRIIANPDRPNISYSGAGCILRNLAVRDLLIESERPAVVFCSSRPGTEKLSRYLREQFADMGIGWHKQVRFYHARLSREEKIDTEKWFMSSREAVLCATCAYGLGVDKADIRTVIHRDCAPSVEAYLQESGRAGRDGLPSKAVILWGTDDKMALKRAGGSVARRRVMAMLRYARDSSHCRRHALLALLGYPSDGEVPEGRCCDVCDNQARSGLREEESLLRFLRANKRRFSMGQACSILSESETIRWSEEEVFIALNHLIRTGVLKIRVRPPWKGRLTLS